MNLADLQARADAALRSELAQGMTPHVHLFNLIADQSAALRSQAAEIERLKVELDATKKRLDKSDELLRDEFAQKQDALATLRAIAEYSHERSTGPAVEDALWEVRRMAYEQL
ncbi:hypothetical protein [Sphingomonas sp.]|uniref:hypothetical protein n=1 Tax=Sphingomonas sp. TaxID=28214 RepID=UPI0035682174